MGTNFPSGHWLDQYMKHGLFFVEPEDGATARGCLKSEIKVGKLTLRSFHAVTKSLNLPI